MNTKVVHCEHEKYDVYIGRPSKWGNPFSEGKDGTRAEVIEKYREYIMSNKELLDQLDELEGKVMGCWCKPLPCHGDILIELLIQRINDFLLKVLIDGEG
jgi:hypothetical protein